MSLFCGKALAVTGPVETCPRGIGASSLVNPMSAASHSTAFVAPLPVTRGPCMRSTASTRPLLPRHGVHRPRRVAAPAVSCSLNDDLARAGVPVGAASGIEDLPLERVPPAGETLPEHWARPGVYGIYSEDGTLVYIAAVRDIKHAIDVHRVVLGDPRRVFAVRMISVDSVDDAPLGQLAYNWLVAHTNEGPGAPEGNTGEAREWHIDEMPREPGGDVYFNANVGTKQEDVEGEIKRILREHKVVLFMKGTREEPRCGFSNATVDLLKQRIGSGFECVDCLDEIKNRGLREGIKTYSDWPTIPQLYVNGDFVGGADIVATMDSNGELSAEFEKAGVPMLAAN